MSKVFKKTRASTFVKKCKHFAGVNFGDDAKTCDAGVLMKDVIEEQSFRYRYGDASPVYTCNYSMPCFKDSDPLNVCRCDKREFPTEDEIKEWEHAVTKGFEDVSKAREAIVVATDGKWGMSGDIECPVCQSGRLRYRVSSLNGHIHASCDSDNCVSWME